MPSYLFEFIFLYVSYCISNSSWYDLSLLAVDKDITVASYLGDLAGWGRCIEIFSLFMLRIWNWHFFDLFYSSFPCNEGKDKIYWRLARSATFVIRLFYQVLQGSICVKFPSKSIWGY